ncbi:MAG TPA: ABC transporter substrate-binding protein [Burkholderiales bacterium]|nr:ABC transporter substrate-binding protein [Burkholderiales bacterium]
MAFILRAVLAIALALAGSVASAETVKIGFITTYTGIFGNIGPYMERAVRLYFKLHDKELPPGTKIELVVRDDTGPNPDKAKQLAQELIVRERVNLLAGVIFTPNALAIAPLATEAKVPFVIMNAGTSMITTRSPYIARTSFTLWQSSYPLGQWAAKKFKTAYTLVSDYGPGHDAEQAFTSAFTAGGGKIAGSVRVPIQTQDWAPYMQRIKDANPEALMVFAPAGKTATAMMKSFEDIGLKKAGVKLIGPGDITIDEELPAMGDVALGVTTVFHWSLAADRPANKAFIAAWKKEYGQDADPDMYSVGSWDGAAMIFEAIKQQKGKLDPDKTMEVFKHWKNPDSPRGPISIDPETRDIVQPEYLREVRRVNGRLENVELETISTAEKDPWKELQKQGTK